MARAARSVRSSPLPDLQRGPRRGRDRCRRDSTTRSRRSAWLRRGTTVVGADDRFRRPAGFRMATASATHRASVGAGAERSLRHERNRQVAHPADESFGDDPALRRRRRQLAHLPLARRLLNDGRECDRDARKSAAQAELVIAGGVRAGSRLCKRNLRWVAAPEGPHPSCSEPSHDDIALAGTSRTRRCGR
jgi:hypothetical protein